MRVLFIHYITLILSFYSFQIEMSQFSVFLSCFIHNVELMVEFSVMESEIMESCCNGICKNNCNHDNNYLIVESVGMELSLWNLIMESIKYQ